MKQLRVYVEGSDMKKKCDCVAMKDAIQARLRNERKGITGAEEAAAVRRWLASSNDKIARWWRKTAPQKANGRGACRNAA